jgi:hypothetical protein
MGRRSSRASDDSGTPESTRFSAGIDPFVAFIPFFAFWELEPGGGSNLYDFFFRKGVASEGGTKKL